VRLLLLPLLTGCSFSAPDGPAAYACSDEEPDCPAGTLCIDGRCSVPADAAPPPDFQFRQELRFALPADLELTEVPVLVTLTPEVFDYDAVRNDGDDIRFTDLADAPLVYEVEEWNPRGRSLLWVKLARLASDADAIWLYYGAADADPPTGAREVWTRYQAVYHLGGGGADSSAGMNDASLTGTTAETGRIGNGRLFDGNDHIDIGPEPPLLRAVPGATLEAWIDPAPLSGDADQVAVAVSGHGTTQSRAQLKLNKAGDAKVVFRTVDADAPSAALVDDRPLAAGEWTWVVAVADFPAGTVRVYLDGVESASVTTTAFSDSTPDSLPDRARLGIDETDIEPFSGVLDEVRIAGDALSDAWIEIQHLSMTGALIDFGTPEAL
jgi:hypothetical protein